MDKNEILIRETFINAFYRYKGCKRGDERETFLCNVYNLANPLPRGVKMKNTMSWCAASISSIALMLQLQDVVPIEMGCWEMMKIAKQKGIWFGRGYEPKPADIIVYDNNKDGAPDHVGLVTSVSETKVYSIEGNVGNSECDTRTHDRNDSAILGYIAPDYASIIEKEEEIKQFIVTTGLYLRQKPSGVGRIVCVMPKNAVVQFLGETNGKWYKVRYADKEGWCSSKYLREIVK